MARVGLSQSFYALYAANGTTVSYSGGGTLGKAVEVSIEPEDSDANVFYANNGPAESASSFGGGTLTITNDRMPLTAVAAVLGLNVASVTTPAGVALTFPAGLAAPYVGYGTVAKMIVDNAVNWRAIMLHKVQFKVPTGEFTTEGESIEFEGHELTAQILRDDSSAQAWMTWADFSTEANAVAWLQAQLAISAATTSEATTT